MRAVPIIAAFSAGQLAIAQQSEDGDLLSNYQDGYQARTSSPEQPIIERVSKDAYCSEEQLTIAPDLSLGFGANARFIRSDLSSVLNLAVSSLFFPSLLWFQRVGLINNP